MLTQVNAKSKAIYLYPEIIKIKNKFTIIKYYQNRTIELSHEKLFDIALFN